MKVEWNKRYTTIAIYSFIVLCCSMIFYITASQMNAIGTRVSEILGILQPFIIGFGIAYLLNFILRFYEERVFELKGLHKIKPKGKRALGILLTYITAGVLLTLFIQFVLPQVVESISGLVESIPGYVDELTKLLDELMLDLDISEEYLTLATDKWNEFQIWIIEFTKGLLPVIGGWIKGIAASIWNIILGIIISIYLLIDKEKFYALGKKITYAVFNKDVANIVLRLTHQSNDTFGKFLSGKILDSAIIGILTFVILTIFKMPYTILISVIIGITNIIPFFGPFFGAIPSTIIILFVSPIQALWFILIIIIIQQLDGNIIGPKILGDSIGISAFWILFSLLVAGKFAGLIGMIIGVPVFAVIYSIIKEMVEGRLKKKGLPSETEDYM